MYMKGTEMFDTMSVPGGHCNGYVVEGQMPQQSQRPGKHPCIGPSASITIFSKVLIYVLLGVLPAVKNYLSGISMVQFYLCAYLTARP